MIVLGIETSCDETALSIIEGGEDVRKGQLVRVLADMTLSQVELHRHYGGVFPNMAKREHSRNLVPLLKTVLEKAGFGNPKSQAPNSKKIPNDKIQALKQILEREPELLEQFLTFILTIEKPPIDAIAVTFGPGLEPCLWTGINMARALSLVWSASRRIPIVPVNHMEGHIFSALLRRKEHNANRVMQNVKENFSSLHASRFTLHAMSFPALALLISGGHTELVLVKDWHRYEIIGQTRDDAVGEAFDKVARLLGLPYPGGPEISKLAEQERSLSSLNAKRSTLNAIHLPRPMLHSGDFDFSFSGLKTAVLYLLKKLEKEMRENHPHESAFSIRNNPRLQMEIALEFENAVTEVLIAKTKQAIEHFGAKTLLLGGGVIANKHLRKEFGQLASDLPITLHIPEPSLTTDNALMIAVAGLIRHTESQNLKNEIPRAQGNLRLN